MPIVLSTTRTPMQLVKGDIVTCHPVAHTVGEWKITRRPILGADGKAHLDVTDTLGSEEFWALEPDLTVTLAPAPPTKREKCITGLRELADFLEANPEIPVSGGATVRYFPENAGVSDSLGEVDRVAALLGVEVSKGVHYEAERTFGAVEYAAIVCDWHGRPAAEAALAKASAAKAPARRGGKQQLRTAGKRTA